MNDLYHDKEWYDQVDGFSNRYLYTNKYLVIERRWQRWKTAPFVIFLSSLITFRILKNERWNNRVQKYILNKIYDDIVFVWIDFIERVDKLTKYTIYNIEVKDAISKYRTDIAFSRSFKLLEKKKLKLSDIEVYSDDRKLINDILDQHYTVDNEYKFLFHKLCLRLNSYIETNNIKVVTNDAFYNLIKELFIGDVPVITYNDKKYIQINFLLKFIERFPPEYFNSLYEKFYQKIKVFGSADRVIGDGEIIFNNNIDYSIFFLYRNSWFLHLFNVNDFVLFYCWDFIIMLITFPEFFLFPVSVMAWIFLKFTVISNDDLKVSKIGYASFFFNKNIKINNSRSLLSSTNNQVKNNLFMWLSLFTIVLFALMKFTDFFYRDIYIQGFFSNALVANNYTYSIKFFLLFLFLGVFLIHDTIFSTKVIIETYNLLLLFSIFPVLLLLVSLNNFFFFYVALEFISLLTYILLFLNKTTNAFEAGIKYFTSGGLISGAFILFGISNLWNIFGSVDIVDIASILGCQKEITSLMVFSFIFIIVGFLFKLAAFPMQQWAPSIYSGIPYSQLGFIMVLFKFILLVVFLRFYITLQPAFFFFISPVTYGIAIGSMCAGLIGIIYSAHNLSIKKFIAYSSITHVGYIFAIIVDTTNEDALWLGLYYSVFYSISILLFFIILSRFLTINKWNDDFSFKEVETFVDLQKFYNSLQYTNQVSNFYKFEFFLLVVSVWSMAGLPPLPGFFGKISILFSLFRSIQWWVYTKWAVVGRMPRHLLDQIFLKEYLVDIMIYFFLFLIFCIIVTSILMVWYYFKFFKYLFLEIPEKDEGEFYDILVPQVYQIGQSKITIETWCQTKVPVIIWNWFLIFYTFWLFIVIFFLSWNALTINLDGMTSNWAFHWIYPVASTIEISVFDFYIY